MVKLTAKLACSLVVNVVNVVDADVRVDVGSALLLSLSREVEGSLLLLLLLLAMFLGLIHKLSAPFSRNQGGSGLRVVVVVDSGEQA